MVISPENPFTPFFTAPGNPATSQPPAGTQNQVQTAIIITYKYKSRPCLPQPTLPFPLSSSAHIPSSLSSRSQTSPQSRTQTRPGKNRPKTRPGNKPQTSGSKAIQRPSNSPGSKTGCMYAQQRELIPGHEINPSRVEVRTVDQSLSYQREIIILCVGRSVRSGHTKELERTNVAFTRHMLLSVTVCSKRILDRLGKNLKVFSTDSARISRGMLTGILVINLHRTSTVGNFGATSVVNMDTRTNVVARLSNAESATTLTPPVTAKEEDQDNATEPTPAPKDSQKHGDQKLPPTTEDKGKGKATEPKQPPVSAVEETEGD